MKVPFLEVSVTVTLGLRWILATLCAYFLVLLGARSYTEWDIWRLRQQASLQEILELNEEMGSDFAAWGARVNAAFAESMQLFEKLREFDKDPEIERMSSQQWVMYERLSSSGDPSHFQQFKELSKAIQERRAALEPLREKLSQQHRDKLDEHRQLASDPQHQMLLGRMSYLASRLPAAKRSLNIRFWFEMMFPILFGTVAILAAIAG